MAKDATAMSVSGADVLDLLQGELAAIETYNQALASLDSQHDESAELRRIRADHQEAAAELRAFLKEFGHDAEVSSGAWGTFAKVVEGTAKLLGTGPALRALREGEQHGLRQYEEFAEERLQPAEFEAFVDRQRSLQAKHVQKLESLLRAKPA
jgi:hypothetical protein